LSRRILDKIQIPAIISAGIISSKYHCGSFAINVFATLALDSFMFVAPLVCYLN
jgi:hypothetical protein